MDRLLECSGNPANPIILRIPIQTNSRLFRLFLVFSQTKSEPFSPPPHTNPASQTRIYERSFSHTWSEFGLVRWIDYWIHNLLVTTPTRAGISHTWSEFGLVRWKDYWIHNLLVTTPTRAGHNLLVTTTNKGGE